MKKQTKVMQDDFGDIVTEARVLPSGGSNIICGKRGYNREMSFRRERNKTLHDGAKFDLPAWESLKIYFSENYKND